MDKKKFTVSLSKDVVKEISKYAMKKKISQQEVIEIA